ncbi:nucleotidyltransferase domain-containing protein [Virgibacillus sp. 6R]|uniref:nucleotidyltransferase domain-containing protein n=1 Tax=Metabacillus sp. 22489 TaxID=3453928 RepID=UPI002104A59C
MTHQIFNEQTESQLKVLAKISTISARIGIEFWLRGGWAIDFILGKITRSHDDIDLITWIQNREGLEDSLLKAGYEKIPVKEEFRERQSDFCKDSVEIQLAIYAVQTMEALL